MPSHEPAVELLTAAHTDLARAHAYPVALRTRWTWATLDPLIESLALMLQPMWQNGEWVRAGAWTRDHPTFDPLTSHNSSTRDGDWREFLNRQIPVELYRLSSRPPYATMSEPGPWDVSDQAAVAWLTQFSERAATPDPQRTVLLSTDAGALVDRTLQRLGTYPAGATIEEPKTGMVAFRQVASNGDTQSGVQFFVPVLAIWQAALLLAPDAARDRVWRDGLAIVMGAHPTQRAAQAERFVALWQSLDRPELQPKDPQFWVTCCQCVEGSIREAAIRTMATRTLVEPPRDTTRRR